VQTYGHGHWRGGWRAELATAVGDRVTPRDHMTLASVRLAWRGPLRQRLDAMPTGHEHARVFGWGIVVHLAITARNPRLPVPSLARRANAAASVAPLAPIRFRGADSTRPVTGRMRVPLDSPENVAVDLSFGTSKICSYSSVTGHPSVAGPAPR
jgi:hypothetical protein